MILWVGLTHRGGALLVSNSIAVSWESSRCLLAGVRENDPACYRRLIGWPKDRTLSARRVSRVTWTTDVGAGPARLGAD